MMLWSFFNFASWDVTIMFGIVTFICSSMTWVWMSIYSKPQFDHNIIRLILRRKRLENIHVVDIVSLNSLKTRFFQSKSSSIQCDQKHQYFGIEYHKMHKIYAHDEPYFQLEIIDCTWPNWSWDSRFFFFSMISFHSICIKEIVFVPFSPPFL